MRHVSGKHSVIVISIFLLKVLIPIKIFSQCDPNNPITSITTKKDVICFGGNTGEIKATISGGTSPYSYLWSANANSQTTSTAKNLSKGTYSVTITDDVGCMFLYTDSIQQPQQLILTGSPNQSVCKGSQATLTASLTGGTSPYSYSWSNSSTTSSIVVTPSVTTTYSVSGFDSKGCGSMSTNIKVTIRNLFKDSLSFKASPLTICISDSSKLIFSYKGGFQPITYSLNQGIGTVNDSVYVSPDSTTTYVLSITDGCNTTLKDSVTVAIDKGPAVALPSLLAEGCLPLRVIFKDTFKLTSPQFTWFFGNDSISYNPIDTQLYTVSGTYNIKLIVSSNDNCADSIVRTSKVNVYPNPKIGCTASPQRTTNLEPDVSFFTDTAHLLLWDFGDNTNSFLQNPIHTYKDTGDYDVSLIAENVYGCKDTCNLLVRVRPGIDLKIPNAFKPTQEGSSGGYFTPYPTDNTLFFPITDFVSKYEMKIFNRWGEMVFQTTDLHQGWDGYYKGKLCQQDQYVWKINILYTDFDRTKIERTGSVMLIR